MLLETDPPVRLAPVQRERCNHARLKIVAAPGSSCGGGANPDMSRYPSRSQIADMHSQKPVPLFATELCVSTNNARADHVCRCPSAPSLLPQPDPNCRAFVGR